MNYSEYCYVEVALHGANKRNNIIKMKDLKVPKNGADHFTTYFRYTEDALIYLQNNIDPKTEKNTFKGYRGSHYADFFPIDVDVEGNPKEALKLARKILNLLETNFYVNLGDLRIYFSGSKGYHILIPSTMFEFEPSENLAKIFKCIGTELLGDLLTDGGIYELKKLFRLPNTVNKKSKRYKIGLTVDEVMSLTDGEIKDMAVNPKDYSPMSVGEVMVNDSLKAMYEHIKTNLHSIKKMQEFQEEEDRIPCGANRDGWLTQRAGKFVRAGIRGQELRGLVWASYEAKCEAGNKPKDYDDINRICTSIEGSEDMKTSGNLAIVTDIKTKQKEVSIDEWGEIVSFDSNRDIEFPVDCIPFLADYIKQVSIFTQTDVSMAGTILLPVLSNCLQKKISINVSVTEDPKDKGYQEQLSIFALVALASGERKSPVFKALTEPLRSYQFEFNENIEPEIKRHQHKITLIQEQIKAQKKIIANGKGSHDAKMFLDDLIEQEILLKPMYTKSLIESDITLERTASLMYENGGKLGIFTDEGGIIKTWSGKYDSNDIEIILSSYSGTGFSVRRQTRDEFAIKDPALSIAIATQEKTLNDLLDNSYFRDKGLTARFLFSSPKSMVGDRDIITKPISNNAENEYKSLINRLLNLEFEHLQVIDFSQEAHAKLIKYKIEHEKNLKYDLKEMREWSGKYIGNLIRIAGVLYVLKNLEFFESGNPFPPSIDLCILESAISLSEYFMENAKKIFLTAERSQEYKEAQYVLDKIRECFNGKSSINKRSLFQKCRVFKKTDEIHPVLIELIERNYISTESKFKDNLKQLKINPKVFV